MLRKLLLSTLLAAGTVTGLALTPATADARSPVEYRHHHRHARFEVLYLDCGHWKCYGNYRERCDADQAACRLRERGYAVKVDRC